MQGELRIGISAFGCELVASASCAEGAGALEQWFFPSLPRLHRAPDPADAHIHIEWANGLFRILLDGLPMASTAEESALGLLLVQVVDEAVVPRLKSLRAVHAGAVAWKERAVLLPGRSHAGKSSLVAALVQRGATYFSDEYALIDAEGRVHPYPRPLLMRNGGPQQVPTPAETLGAVAREESAPVGWVLALEYGADAEWKVASLPQSQALMTLLRNTPHLLAEMPEMVGFFGCAVAGAHCFHGLRNEASEAAEEILRLLERTS